jgi:hypothetical protein
MPNDLGARLHRVQVTAGPRITIEQLDARFEEFDCPMWDNTNYLCAAMRADGFVHQDGDTLIFQELITGLGDAGITRIICVYTPEGGGPRFELTEQLVGEDQLYEWLIAAARHNKLTGAVTHQGGGEYDRCLSPPNPLPSHATCVIHGEPITLPLTLPAHLYAHYGPVEAWMIALAELRPDVAFCSPAQLAALLDLPPDAAHLFTWRDFVIHTCIEPASHSPDLVAMVDALAAREAADTPPHGMPFLRYLERRAQESGGWGDVTAWGR